MKTTQKKYLVIRNNGIVDIIDNKNDEDTCFIQLDNGITYYYQIY